MTSVTLILVFGVNVNAVLSVLIVIKPKQKGKLCRARAREAECLCNAQAVVSRPYPDCAFAHVTSRGQLNPRSVNAHQHMPAHVSPNNLNTNEYVRALIFFVWQHREAPKE